MSILYVCIDLAKNVFAVHGVNGAGAAELRQPKVKRAKLHEPPRILRRLLRLRMEPR